MLHLLCHVLLDILCYFSAYAMPRLSARAPRVPRYAAFAAFDFSSLMSLMLRATICLHLSARHGMLFFCHDAALIFA